jgi:cytochrome c oxidase assembly factor CtaG
MPALIALCLLVASVGPALAHGEDAHGSPEWTFDPWITVPLLTAGVLYALGTAKLSRRSRTPRVSNAGSAAYWSGLLLLAVALVSPLHYLGEHLFTFHMIEHEIVMAAAAPLIVLARPIGVLFWGLPRPLRRPAMQLVKSRGVETLWSAATAGSVATLLHAAAIWLWHVPALFDATVTSVLLHRLQHLSFFITAVIFWWAVIWREGRGVGAWHLFLTMLHTSILGALIAVAPRVVYLAQTRYAADWGLSSLEDQQLAGIIMWVPGGIVYAGAALVMLAGLIRGSSSGGAHAGSVGIS